MWEKSLVEKDYPITSVDGLIEKLYIIIQHKRGGNNSGELINEACPILDLLLEIKKINKRKHKRLDI